MGVCMRVCLASSLYRRLLLVFVMYANIAECLQKHKAVILLLIMKAFDIKEPLKKVFETF